jgi:mRNA-degrading endonuclease toxin of MazEF toxin-antitoxin module
MPTQFMTTWRKGDVVLVPIGFTDQSGAKRRPAVVISSDPYNTQSPQHTIAGRDDCLDHWQPSGRPPSRRSSTPSLAGGRVAAAVARAGQIAAVENSIVARKLGRLSRDDVTELDRGLREALGLS